MNQLIFFVILKDFSKFTPMNAINEIELKLPWALFNIGLAIVGQKVVNSAFVLLSGFCAKVGQTFFKCPTIAKPSR
jgi:hypothetical protein